MLCGDLDRRDGGEGRSKREVICVQIANEFAVQHCKAAIPPVKKKC